jgi:dihydroflavonol-4-reductase
MIFVTGGTGLIGSHLLFQLAKKGNQIRALRRRTSNVHILNKVFGYYSDNTDKLLSHISWYEADILNKESLRKAFEGIEHVYHCAALISFIPREDKYVLGSNVQSTRNIIELCLESGVSKLCHLSSVAAIGRRIDDDYAFMNEETPWEDSKNLSAYTRSKYLSEQEVWKAIEKGMNAVIVNPTIVFGPGDWKRSSSRMFYKIWKGLRFYSGGSNSFVDVRDVCSAMIKLMESNITGERFIVTSENLSFREIFNLIADNLNKKKPSVKITRLMGEIAWRMNKLFSLVTGTPPLLTRETVRAGVSRVFFSNEKIRKRLNFDFITIEQSVKDTCRLLIKDMAESR